MRSVSAIELICWPFAISKDNSFTKDTPNCEMLCELHINGVRLVAGDRPSEGRLQIRSWDVMASVWRVSLNIGAIRETFTFASCATRIEIKQLVYIYICTLLIGRWVSLLVNLYCGHFKVEALHRWMRSVSAIKLVCWLFAISKANCVCMTGTERQLSAVSFRVRALMKNTSNCEM